MYVVLIFDCIIHTHCRCWISDKDGAIWAFIGPMIAMICVSKCIVSVNTDLNIFNL